jgi:hypothetical protein
MQKVLDVIKWIVLFPISWMPESWQGIRRSIIAGAIVILTALAGLDLVNLGIIFCTFINAIVHIWNQEFLCDLTPWLVGFTIWIPLLLEALKSDTERSIFKTGKK